MADEATNEPRDIFAVLLQDHARIEEHLKALDRAADILSRTESDAAALAIVNDALNFFATEGTRHEAREERTLFPRLRPLPEFKQILSALEFQHRMNATGTEELAACVKGFGPGSGSELKRLTYRFVEMHRGHAIAEERALFPLARTRLAPEVVAEMSREKIERV